MEEDNEVLDWGNEDDEQQYEQRVHNQQTGDGVAEEAEEDAVSLGGDEDDTEHYYAYKSTQPDERPAPSSKPVSSHQQQQQTPNSAPVSQASNRDLQREHSGGSVKTHTHVQYSPHHSPKRRSQSFGKMTHSLPPKPIVSAVPFLQPTHSSSIIEATAMSVHREKKNGKPISSADAVDALPPDWEVKQPRSGGGGVYYYNVRTHQSTWTRPVSGGRSPAKDKERPRTLTGESRPRSGNSSPVRASELLKPYHSGRSEEPPVSQSALSYDDRHYRPGEAPPAEKRREERFDPSNKRSSTPPRSPRMSPNHLMRPPSPMGRGRDEKRGSSRTVRKSSPPMALPGDYGSLRDPQREQRALPPPRDISPDRHWIAPQDPSRKVSGRRPASSHDHQHQRSEEAPSAPPAHNEDRSSFRNDADWSSSTLRHRSPSRDTRIHVSQASRDSGAPPQPPASRPKSRFDQPASAVRKPSTRTDSHHQTEAEHIPRERERKPEWGAEMVNDSYYRPRMDDYGMQQQQLLEDDSPPASVLGGSRSPSPESEVHPTDQSRLKRTPLPPQSARFREVVTRRKPEAPQLQSAIAFPSRAAPEEGGMVPRGAATNSNNDNTSLPSGPRRQSQTTLVEPHNARMPPSGPSTGRPRKSDPGFASNQPLPLRDRDRDRNMMDTDPPPRFRMNDIPIRANSGMYADREQQRVEQGSSTDAPRGPKAMINTRVSNSSAHPSFASSPSSSPATPFFPQRSLPGQGKFPDRSPPPHLAQDHGFQPRERGHPPPGERRGVPGGRRSDVRGQTNDMEPEEPVPQREHAHSRHNQPPPQAHVPLPLTFSGSNSVPIGSRKGSNMSLPPQAAVIPQPPSRGRFGPPITTQVEPVRGQPVRRDSIPQSAFEHTVSTPAVTYRDTSRRQSVAEPGTSPHQRRPISPVDSFNASAALGRSRGADSWFSGANSVQSVVQRQQEIAPRTWTQRQAGQTDAARSEQDFHAATPPPPSRDSSWEADRHRQYQPDRLPPPAAGFNGYNRHEDAVAIEPRHRRGEVAEITRKEERGPPQAQHDRRGLAPSLENRISGQQPGRFAEASFAPRGGARSPTALRTDPYTAHDPYVEGPRRPSYSDDRAPIPQSWNREPDPQEQGLPPSAVRLHPDRARTFEEDPSLDVPRQSKPIRIRRPPPQSVTSHSEDYPMQSEIIDDRWVSNGNGRGEERHREVTDSVPRTHGNNSNHPRPTPPRRGGSLLDRLSTNGAGPSEMAPPSLRDRVQIPAKRNREEMGGDDGHNDMDIDDLSGDPYKKRAGMRRLKVKKGRRSGP